MGPEYIKGKNEEYSLMEGAWVYNITQQPKQKNEAFHYRNFGKIQEFSLTIFLCWIVDRIETTNRLAGDLQGTSWHLFFFANILLLLKYFRDI